MSGNSIRYRLKQPEVHQFEQTGNVTEVIAFGEAPSERLMFILEKCDAEDLAVTFQSNTTTILVPSALAAEWTQTGMVGFDAALDTGKGARVRILVEKDFACLDDAGVDNEGAYPNPKSYC